MSLLTSFYSQNFEDVLLSRVLSDIADGTYVDVGCQHETQDSVTRYFYERGWSGINIDPVSEHIEEYSRRDRDINLNLAAGSHPSALPFTVVDGSGLSSFHASHVDCARIHGLHSMEERWVEVKTLNAILEQHLSEGRAIAFLKIDVEGHEYEVLKGLDLRRYRPIIILVETTRPCSTLLVENFSAISDYICANGYHEVYFDGINTWWIAEEQHAMRSHHFQYPVGVFDGFSPYEIRRLLLQCQKDQPDLQDLRDLEYRQDQRGSLWPRFARRLRQIVRPPAS